MRTPQEEAAKKYVETNPDSEVRRMYGHHFRSFIAGTKYADTQTADLIKVLMEVNSYLNSFKHEWKDGEVYLSHIINHEISKAEK